MATMKSRSNGSALKKLDFAISELESKRSQAGWFESAKYEDGTSIAYVASIHEFGVPSKNIPPRSFMRTTMEDKKSEWSKLAKQGAKSLLKGSETASTVMGKLAASAVGDVQEKISSILTPELSPVTIELRSMRKKDPELKIGGKVVGEAYEKVHKDGYVEPTDVSTKPLVDSGILMETMTYVVEDVEK